MQPTIANTSSLTAAATCRWDLPWARLIPRIVVHTKSDTVGVGSPWAVCALLMAASLRVMVETASPPA